MSRLNPRLLQRSLLVLCLTACVSAHAQPDDLIQPYVFYNITRDNNILLTSTNTQSDQYQQTGVGTIFNWQQSRQQVTGRIGVNRTRFSKLNVLDYSGFDFLGQWNWQLGNHSSGQLGYSDTRSLGSFLDYTGSLAQNTVDTKKQFFTAGYQFHPRWSLKAALDRETLNYSASSLSSNDRTIDHVELGAEYATPKGSRFGPYAARWRGNYANAGASYSDYTQDEFGLRTHWSYSGKLTLDSQIARTSRSQQNAPGYDFSGLTGNISTTWQATGKISLGTSIYRSIYAAQNYYSSYSVNNGIRLIPAWQVTPKINLSLNAYYESRSFEGDPFGYLAILGTAKRHDNAQGSTLSVNYSPQDWISLSLSYQNSKRNSNYQTFDFSDQSLSFSVQAQF